MSKDSSSIKLQQVTNSENTFRFKGFVATILSLLITFFGAQYLSVFAVALLLVIFGLDKYEISDLFTDNITAQLLIAVTIAVVSIKVIVKILKRKKIDSKDVLMINNKPTIGNFFEVLITYGLYFLTIVAVTVLLDMFSGVDVNQTQQLGLAESSSLISKIQLFAVVAVLPPIYEELLFRGYLYNMLTKYSSKITAGIATCVLFGMAHLEYNNLNWIAAIDTLIFSAYLIYISQKHNSIYSSMLMHSLKNAIAFYVLFVR